MMFERKGGGIPKSDWSNLMNSFDASVHSFDSTEVRLRSSSLSLASWLILLANSGSFCSLQSISPVSSIRT